MVMLLFYLFSCILTKNVVLCMDSGDPSSIQNMEDMSPPAYPLDSSSSSGISLLGHASSETDSETSFQTPRQSLSSSTHSSESSPNNEENIPFMSSLEDAFWKKFIIEKLNERLAIFDPYGKVGHIPDAQIVSAFRLDSSLQTKEDAENIVRELLHPNKKNPLEVERGSVDAIMYQLIEKNRRSE